MSCRLTGHRWERTSFLGDTYLVCGRCGKVRGLRDARAEWWEQFFRGLAALFRLTVALSCFARAAYADDVSWKLVLLAAGLTLLKPPVVIQIEDKS